MSVVPSSFEDFESLADIEREQKDLVEVFVEGASDRILFSKYWFFNLIDRIDFKQPPDGGGCVAVIDAVARSRQLSDVPSYGIVDRDVWRRLHDHAALFEADDAAYHARVLEPGVYVTRLWEVEAYLLDPRAIYVWLSTHGRSAPHPPCTYEEMLSRLDAMAECLLEVSELNVFLHHLERPGIPEFASGESDAVIVRGLVRTKLERLAGPVPHDHQPLMLDLQHKVEVVREVAGGLRSGAKLQFLLRFIDSKALVERIGDAFKLIDRRVWQLAQDMRASSARPEELEVFLLGLCAGTSRVA